MKRIVALIAVLCILLVSVSCGNMDMIDTVYTYDYAIISFPDGSVQKVEIKKWRDYEDGDQIQIIAEDDTVYLVHSMNCILVAEP